MEDHRVHEAPIQRILVKNGTSVVVIPSESIDYIEAEDDYVAVHSGGKRHLKQERLSELAQLLDPVRFIRIHRSFILNIDRLARLETYAKDSRVAILKDGTKLPVSRSGHDRLREIL
jgi:two-component system LytT family response regulator